MKQSDGVYQAICEVLGQTEFDKAVELTKEQRDEVRAIVMTGLKEGTIDLSEKARAKYDDGTDSKFANYTSGLVSNWLRKDKRLNGGIAYMPKNPGSRAGAGDAMLRELKKLRTLNAGDTDKVAEIDAYIEIRQEEIKSKKERAVNINTDLIPEALRHLATTKDGSE